jgi:hypothetical protein
MLNYQRVHPFSENREWTESFQSITAHGEAQQLHLAEGQVERTLAEADVESGMAIFHAVLVFSGFDFFFFKLYKH